MSCVERLRNDSWTHTCAAGVHARKKVSVTQKEVPPGFEPGLPESEPDVITNYTMGPKLCAHGCKIHLVVLRCNYDVFF